MRPAPSVKNDTPVRMSAAPSPLRSVIRAAGPVISMAGSGWNRWMMRVPIESESDTSVGVAVTRRVLMSCFDGPRIAWAPAASASVSSDAPTTPARVNGKRRGGGPGAVTSSGSGAALVREQAIHASERGRRVECPLMPCVAYCEFYLGERTLTLNGVVPRPSCLTGCVCVPTANATSRLELRCRAPYARRMQGRGRLRCEMAGASH